MRHAPRVSPRKFRDWEMASHVPRETIRLGGFRRRVTSYGAFSEGRPQPVRRDVRPGDKWRRTTDDFEQAGRCRPLATDNGPLLGGLSARTRTRRSFHNDESSGLRGVFKGWTDIGKSRCTARAYTWEGLAGPALACEPQALAGTTSISPVRAKRFSVQSRPLSRPNRSCSAISRALSSHCGRWRPCRDRGRARRCTARRQDAIADPQHRNARPNVMQPINWRYR